MEVSSITRAGRHVIVGGDHHLGLAPDRASVDAGIIIDEDQWSMSINSVQSILPWVGLENVKAGAHVKTPQKADPENVKQTGLETKNAGSLVTVLQTGNQHWWTCERCET